MKIRNGFVSNSSSSSFVIKTDDLTDIQIRAIIKHSDIANILCMDCAEEAWSISLDAYEIKGRTWMDNFDMEEYLIDLLGIDSNVIYWSD